MTWHAKYHSEELRNRSTGLRERNTLKFRAAQRLLMPRRIDIEGRQDGRQLPEKKKRGRVLRIFT